MLKKFVSTGGEKLQFALDSFNLSVKNLVCADFGASKGGFTDCLLQNGAKRVYAVEIGSNTLDWDLRTDTKIVIMDRTDATHVDLPEKMDIIAIDVGQTKQKEILPNAIKNLKEKGTIITLINPFYEAPDDFISEGELVGEKVDEVMEKVRKDIEALNLDIVHLLESPVIDKKDKNKEYLALLKEVELKIF